MTTIKELLKELKINIDIPTTWQNYEVDDENKYTYHPETHGENTIHVLRTKGYDRMGNEGDEEIIIDTNQKLITFLGADGVMTQMDSEGNITDESV